MSKISVSLRLLSICFLLQASLNGMYSSTTPVFRSFPHGLKQFNANLSDNPNSSNLVKESGTFSSRMERRMNAGNSPALQKKEPIIPEIKLHPEDLQVAVKSVKNNLQDSSRWVSMNPSVHGIDPLNNPNLYLYVDDNNLTFPLQVVDPVQNFKLVLYNEWNDFMPELQKIAEKSLKDQLMFYELERNFLRAKKEQLNNLKHQYDPDDRLNLDNLVLLENLLVLVIADRDLRIEELLAQIEEEHVKAKMYADQFSDKKNKNRFYSGVNIGVGAGTLYGLKKYQEGNEK